MRIAINAQLDPKYAGGIAQVILGLAHSLGRLDGPEEYLFVCSPDSASWLEPHLGANSRIEINARLKPSPWRGVRESDGFWESFSPDVIHFPYQSYTQTDRPTVFNPHDLQHVHLPQLFTEDERARRETLYAQACQLAAAVAVTSGFVKNDIVRQYGIPADRVHVIWWGSPSAAYQVASDDDTAHVLEKHDLPDRFAIYPAQTWPHKNHGKLLEALHLLRTRHNVIVPLVCTGARNDDHAQLTEQVSRLKLGDQVRFLGWVDEHDLMALYRAAEMMIVPTLFEAISFPVFEAFAEGVAVACSAVTSLPEQVGDAALLFDPHDVEAIATVILQLHQDEALRRRLVARGHERLKRFSWTTTAKQYRALYRNVAGRLHSLSTGSEKA